jgi:hypothetical protein
MMRIGSGAEVEFLVVAAGSGQRCDVSGTFMPFPLCYCSSELLSGSSEGSWSREKWWVSAAKQGRGRGLKMAEILGQERPPWPPFFSVAGKTQSSLSTRERSWLALGPFGEGVGWWWCGLAKRNRRREGVQAL